MVLEVTILGKETHQVIHSFGASDAWGANEVGLWDGAGRQEIAELLFDRSLDEDGRPRGIGLSCWRVLAGAGSARIAKGERTWRHTDTFLKPEWTQRGVSDDTSYDFTRNPGQQWFIHAARKYSVPHFVLFAHSPPYPLTANGGTASDVCSLRSKHNFSSRDYAAYLCKIAAHYERFGVRWAAITPAHEPHWTGSDGDLEYSPFTNEELGMVAQALDEEIRIRQLGSLVAVPEAGCIDYLLEQVPGHERSSGFVQAYFGNGELCPPKALSLVTGHSYFTCWPQEDRLIETREKLASALRPCQKNGVQYWATEYSVYIPLDEPFVPKQVVRALSPGGRFENIQDRANIDAALWAARVIHADLAVANASAWHWWLALSPTDVPDGLIRYDNEEQTYSPTKSLYILGHFSLFIRPGMRRVSLKRADNKVHRETLEEVLLSAYVGNGTVVMVAINMSHVDEEVQVDLKGCGAVLGAATWFSSYLTSATTSLHPYHTFALGDTVRVPRRSVVTSTATVVSNGFEFFFLAASSEHGVPMCLEVSQASPSKCAVVGLNKLSGHAHQAWRVTSGPEGLYLTACHSGHSLEVVNASTMSKAPLHQNGTGGGLSQQWEIKRLSNGTAYISVKHVGHVIEAYGNSVRVTERAGKPEQLWFMVPRDSDLRDLPSNPALAANRNVSAAKTAWSSEWVDELPPPMSQVKNITKPRGRYEAPSVLSPLREKPGSATSAFEADELRKELQRQSEQLLQHEQIISTQQKELRKVVGREEGGSRLPKRTGSVAASLQSFSDQSVASDRKVDRRRSDVSSTKGRDRDHVTAPPFHILLNLAVQKSDFDTTFQQSFKHTIARSMGVTPSTIGLEYVGTNPQGVEAKVFLAEDDTRHMRDRLVEAVNLAQNPRSPTPSTSSSTKD